MPCFTMIISSLPAWALLLLLVIDGVVLTVWALPSRPQSAIAAKRLAPNVRSACLQQDSLGIAIGFMTYLGREKMTKIGVTLSIGGLARLSFEHWEGSIMLSTMALRFIACDIYCCCTWSSKLICVEAVTVAVWSEAHLQLLHIICYFDRG